MIHELKTSKLPENCVVFKHSTRCPVSSAAAAEVESFAWPVPLYRINVIEQRDLSNWVRDEYGVAHESPQLIRIEGGKATQTLTHGSIRSQAVSRWFK